ncbi:hypothetical protein HJG60_011303 [Phyllostomus discolor]|uniref:Uncharacterized protein n=1 Tax=Phyllostomus discolor TaxID=89673 RepID=A0A834E7Q1_9CHIR|nr:hypothetical protein HJG60_011303 [Phyllostomus discolor]
MHHIHSHLFIFPVNGPSTILDDSEQEVFRVINQLCLRKLLPGIIMPRKRISLFLPAPNVIQGRRFTIMNCLSLGHIPLWKIFAKRTLYPSSKLPFVPRLATSLLCCFQQLWPRITRNNTKIKNTSLIHISVEIG